MKIELELGIISQEQKEYLNNHMDSRHFIQRKQYPEYYVDVDCIETVISIHELMFLAEQFTVSISINSVVIST